MKIGVSSYSLSRLFEGGKKDYEWVIDWSVENGGEHVEIVDSDHLDKSEAGLTALREYAAKRGLDISSYTFGADFGSDNKDEVRAETERVKKQIDRANALGVKRARHDVAGRPPDKTGVEEFERVLPRLAAACAEVADYAAAYGITTSLENHGYFLQDSERVRRLILATDRPNFRTTIDVGNFTVVDEDPVSAVKLNLPYASHIHLKDFHLKPAGVSPGQGWFQSRLGRYIRGAIFGHGDVATLEIMRLIVASGYDGYLSLEFVGMEEPCLACRVGLENIRRFLEIAQEETRRE